jgi:hypothetical protein
MKPTIITDIVYSPDDGGWYAQQTNLDAVKSRVTKRIYSSEALAREAAKPGARHAGKSPWEAWS